MALKFYFQIPIQDGATALVASKLYLSTIDWRMSLVLQKKKILLVDSDQSWASALQKNLPGELSLSLSDNLSSWLNQAEDQLYDLILLSSAQGKNLATASIERFRKLREQTRVILLADAAEKETDWTEYPLSIIDNIVNKPKNVDELLRIMGEQSQKPEVCLRYHPKLISSFTTATREIMEFYTQQYPTIGKVELTTDRHAHKVVTGLISFISRDVKGTLSIEFDEAFFQKVAQSTLAEEGSPADPESLQDFAGEICNQVLGKVKLKLADEGVRLTASLPRVLAKRGKPVFDEMNHEMVQVPLLLDKSHCMLRFNML